MLIDIDIHYLAKVVNSLSAMEKVIMQDFKSCPKLTDLLKEHKGLILFLAHLVDETQKNAKQFANLGKGV